MKNIVFGVRKYLEEDHSVTMTLQGFDMVVNEENEELALNTLIYDLREYATEYYEDINFWMTDPIRKKQFGSILKVLMIEENEELKESFLILTDF